MVEDAMEITAPSVDEAIILGLTRMGVTREEVSIEILSESSRGFLGLGARPAQVRLTRRPADLVKAPPAPPAEPTPAPPPPAEPPSAPATPAPTAKPSAPPAKPIPMQQEPEKANDNVDLDEELIDDLDADEETDNGEEEGVESIAETVEEEPAPATAATEAKPRSRRAPRAEKPVRLPENLDQQAIEAVAAEVAEHLFAGLRVKTVLGWRQEERVTLWISLRGRDADMLVGPRAQTLNHVQYLFRTLLHHRIEGDYNVVIDADGYRKRRRDSLESLARKKAEQAVSSGRTIRLRPMPPNDRRVIHMVLRQDQRVQTESVGNGENRAITIIPIRKAERE